MVGILTISFVTMLIIAIWAYRESKKNQLHELVRQHFKEVLPSDISVVGHSPQNNQRKWQDFKVRASIYAGFEIRRKHLFVLPLTLIFLLILGWLAYGAVGAILISCTSIFLFGFLLPYTRLQRRKAQTIAQIPLFIDQIIRTLSTGRSLESAIRFAADEADLPLRIILDRVIRSADLGADLVESLAESARLHRLRELNLVALAMRISNNYGSSPQGMLESVVKMVRQQEQARNELAAMTGETRISAWVLGLTPVAIATYIMVMNPNYLNMLLQDSTGEIMVIIALLLQGTGACILWRMLRSV